jgi:hypothetical protein
MSDEEFTLGMSIPLDADGFLRRECPTCEREFKWMPNADDENDDGPVLDGGYFCPYCCVQAPTTEWLTQAQAALARNIVEKEVVGPLLKDFGKEIDGIGKGSGGLIGVSVDYDEPDELDPLTETDDMKRVDFECHPLEPVKILDAWNDSVACLICGATSN